MLLRFQFRILSALAIILVLASCSKTNKQGRMVPKEAGFVMHVSGKSLSGKMSMAELKKADWYIRMKDSLDADSTAPMVLKKMAAYDKNTGIDSLSDYIIFSDNSSTSGTHMVVEVGLKDAAAFEVFIKSVYPQGNITKDGELRELAVENKGVLAWNNEKVVIGFLTPVNTFNDKINANDSGNTVDIPQLVTYCKNLYTLTEDNSMAKNEKFTDMVNTEGDMHAWVNYEKLFNNMPDMGALSMLKLDNFLVGNITAYTLNFENGRISVKSKGYAGKELAAILKKYSVGQINTDMLQRIPSRDVVGVFAMHFDPAGLKELLSLTGMEGLADLFLAKNGFTIDDFIKANKGDIMIAVSDLILKKDTITTEGPMGESGTLIRQSPDASYIFSASINDKDAFNKIIGFAKKETEDIPLPQVSYNTSKEYFAIGNSPDYISKYLAGGKSDQPFITKLSGSPIGLYINLQKIIGKSAGWDKQDSVTLKVTDESLKMWDNIIMNGGDYSNGGMNQSLEINLMDKSTNSLKQLSKYMVTVASLEKDNIRMRQQAYVPVTDSVVDIRPTVKPMNRTHQKVRKK